MNCTFIVRFNFAYTLETTNLQFHQHNDHDVDKMRYGGKRTTLPDVISTDKLINKYSLGTVTQMGYSIAYQIFWPV